MRKIIITALILFPITACNDYLNEENKSNILEDGYYQTTTGYETLVNTTYSSLRDVYDDPYMYMAGTDEFVDGRNYGPPGLSLYAQLVSADLNVTTYYTACYKAIQRCNTAIYYNSRTQAATTLDNRLGEVKFLRAYYYFLLVQQFGDVSLVLDLIQSPVLKFERTSAADVYTFIINEMNDALARVPATAAQFGRVDQRVVKHFLSKVYLTRGYEAFAAADDFTNAATLADAVINGQSLSISFEDLFWPGKEKNTEVIFSIQYDKSSMSDLTTDGTNQNYFFGPYLGGEGASKGYPYRSYTLMPTAYVYNLFTKDDSRWEGTFMNVAYGQNSKGTSQYYDFYNKSKADRTGLFIQFYYPQSWETDTAAWRAADPVHRGTTQVNGTKIYPTWLTTLPGVGLDGGQPIVRKFDDPTSQFSLNGSSTRDVYLARLAETYLIAAEAYLKTGDMTKAAARINEVRRRAAKTVGALAITEGQVTIDFILDERSRELLGEYDRWFDLKRTGKLVERTSLYNRDIKKFYFDNGINPFLGPDGELKLLRPIPQKALDLNQDDDVKQNPGYAQ